MKITSTAKIIVDIKNFESDYPTWREIEDLIKSGNYEMEFIGAWLSGDFQPTLLITEK